MGAAFAEVTELLASKPKKKSLIGVSGGCDSVALLHLLHEAGHKNLVVCHLDHRLRGRASTGDAAFVERLARELGYVVEMGRVDVGKQSRASGKSIETAAREARHTFFADCARRQRCNRVLITHHADDQAETVLMNILRGASLHGLGGIQEESPIKVGRRTLTLHRPLLSVRRSQLELICEEMGWAYREDASNKDPKHTRNRIRHELLPLASEILQRDPTGAINRLAAHAAADHALLDSLALAELEPAICDEGLNTRVLKSLSPAILHRVLHRWLRGQGIPRLDQARIEEVAKLLRQRFPAKVNLPGDRHLRRRSCRLFIEPSHTKPT